MMSKEAFSLAQVDKPQNGDRDTANHGAMEELDLDVPSTEINLTQIDHRDMTRLGRRQELNVGFC